MIIDFHVHCFPDSLASRAVKALSECAGISANADGTVAGIKRSMETAGIDYSVIQSIATKPSQTQTVNTWSGEITETGIVAFGSIHPDYGQWEDELDRIKEMGLKGIKLHPDYQNFFADEDRLLPIYGKASDLGLIVLFHAGVDIGLAPPYHCTPMMLKKIVRQFPGGKFVAAHMGGYSYWNEVEEHLVGEDIYLDTSYSLGFMDRCQAGRIIDNHGYNKILFATDSPWADQRTEIQRVKDLGLSAEAEEAILGRNAYKLLKLDN